MKEFECLFDFLSEMATGGSVPHLGKLCKVLLYSTFLVSVHPRLFIISSSSTTKYM